jgi:hypothetical protein
LSITPELPHHGTTFTRVLVDATAEFCGPDRAAQLAAAYVEQRVKIGAPPHPDDGGVLRYGHDERVRLERSRARRERVQIAARS